MASASSASLPVAATSFVEIMPVEVLLQITDNLTTPELCKFRSTCRAIEQALYDSFTSEFFTRKQFMITNFSLQALVDMAASRIGQHMRVVQFGTDHFKDLDHHGYASDSHYAKLRAESDDMWETRSWKGMLTEAFRSLPHLEDIVIRDCNSTGRWRDADPKASWKSYAAEWRSYGSNTILEETGQRLPLKEMAGWNHHPFVHDIPSLVFNGVLGSLGESGSQAKGIEVISRNGWRLRKAAFALPEDAEDAAFKALSRLEKLHLTIEFRGPDAVASPSGETDGPETEKALLDFLSQTPNVKDLRINTRYEGMGWFGEPLEFLARPSSEAGSGAASGENPPSPPPGLLPNLEELSLGVLDTKPSSLLGVITRFAPSLKSLELWKVRLFRPLPEGGDIDPEAFEIPFWPPFFKKLKEIPELNLRHIKVGMLQQFWRGRTGVSRVSFKDEGPTIAYTGPDWQTFVEKSVLPQLKVEWAPAPEPIAVYNETDEDDSDGSGDEDEDDEGDEDEGEDDE